MASKDKFAKIIQKFKLKFSLTKNSFKQFVQTRVQIDPEYLKQLFQEIDNKPMQEPDFGENGLRQLLHMLAAKQAGCSLSMMDEREIKKFYKITFLDKKKKSSAISERTQAFNQENKSQHKKQKGFSKTEIMEDQDQNKDEGVKTDDKEKGLKTIEEELTDEVYLDSTKQKQGQVIISKSIQSIDKKVKKFDNQQKELKKESKHQLKHQLKHESSNESSNKFNKTFGKKKEQEKSSSKLVVEQAECQNIQHEVVQDQLMEENQISIAKFEKMGQDFMNPIIKYQIIYKDNFVTWRRYSEIEKMMTYLRRKYEGVVLPELPPKEGIKGGISYFWSNAVDEGFLCERKEKLQNMLNRLLQKTFVNKDPELIKFFSQENYEMHDIQSGQNYWDTLSGWKDIVLNYNELKDYGMAYYNYFNQCRNRQLQTDLAKKYSSLKEIIDIIMTTNSHRKSLNTNFDRRRQIMYMFDLKVNQPERTELDKHLQKAQIDYKELAHEYNKYVELKLKEGWLHELKNQKRSQQGTKSLQKINMDLDGTIKRIETIENNLSISIQEFRKKMQFILLTLGSNIINWRKKIHP